MNPDREATPLSHERGATSSPMQEVVVRPRRLWSASLFAGLVAMLLVAAGGVAYALMAQPERWTATADVLIVPELPQADIGSYFEVLSRGQVTATAAEIMGDDRFLTSAALDVEIDPAEVESNVSVVPGTAVLTFSVTADEPADAEAIVDRLVSRSMPTVNELLSPFEVRTLGPADGSAVRSGLSLGQLASAIGLLTIVVGVAVQQATQHIMTARRQVVRQKT